MLVLLHVQQGPVQLGVGGSQPLQRLNGTTCMPVKRSANNSLHSTATSCAASAPEQTGSLLLECVHQ